jgi:hypothetical protein
MMLRSLVTAQMVALQTEALSPVVIGLIAFLLLLAMMGIVFSIGKGRPHS